jgi:hypothetical protein
MPVFLNTLALFAGSMATHFMIWKVRLPKRQIRALLINFAAVFSLWLALSLVHHAALLALLQVALYYWSISLCYTITYSAVEGESPTLGLMRYVAGGGSEGRSAGEIARFLDERRFLGSRLAALVESGLVREQDGRYVIAGKQPVAFRLILGFRNLYGSIPKGG